MLCTHWNKKVKNIKQNSVKKRDPTIISQSLFSFSQMPFKVISDYPANCYLNISAYHGQNILPSIFPIFPNTSNNIYYPYNCMSQTSSCHA